jgi:hypothetical protein
MSEPYLTNDTWLITQRVYNKYSIIHKLFRKIKTPFIANDFDDA